MKERSDLHVALPNALIPSRAVNVLRANAIQESPHLPLQRGGFGIRPF